MRGCEAAASDLATAVIAPAHIKVHAISHEFDQRPGPVKQSLGRLASNKIYRDDAWEMGRPFSFGTINVIARGDNVTSGQISGINPILVEEDVVFAAAPEAAIEYVITALNSSAGGFPNNHRP